MKKIFGLIILSIIITLALYMAFHIEWSRAFSPGALSKAHKDFDHLAQCKACHAKGRKLDNGKCLACHEEIGRRIKKSSGLHARISHECSGCHSEHHGREYNPIHFDKETFEHNTTGWQLEGIHALLRCTTCHLKNTYLLDTIECVHCHQDIHEGENGQDCGECHNQDSFEGV